jgi:hypothetical protein
MPREAVSAIVGAAATERLLVASPAAVASQGTEQASAGVTTTLGVKQTTTVVARGVQNLGGRVVVQARWTILGAGADGTARLNATLTRNGVAITGVTAANGPARSFGTGGDFRETLAIQAPANLDPAATDTLEVVLTVEVTVAGTGNRDIDIKHDPATAANRLVVVGLD